MKRLLYTILVIIPFVFIGNAANANNTVYTEMAHNFISKSDYEKIFASLFKSFAGENGEKIVQSMKQKVDGLDKLDEEELQKVSASMTDVVVRQFEETASYENFVADMAAFFSENLSIEEARQVGVFLNSEVGRKVQSVMSGAVNMTADKIQENNAQAPNYNEISKDVMAENIKILFASMSKEDVKQYLDFAESPAGKKLYSISRQAWKNNSDKASQRMKDGMNNINFQSEFEKSMARVESGNNKTSPFNIE